MMVGCAPLTLLVASLLGITATSARDAAEILGT